MQTVKVPGNFGTSIFNRQGTNKTMAVEHMLAVSAVLVIHLVSGAQGTATSKITAKIMGTKVCELSGKSCDILLFT